jgi:hypothetical protein
LSSLRHTSKDLQSCFGCNKDGRCSRGRSRLAPGMSPRMVNSSLDSQTSVSPSLVLGSHSHTHGTCDVIGARAAAGVGGKFFSNSLELAATREVWYRGFVTVRVFRQKFALEDTCDRYPLLLPVGTVNCVQTLKVVYSSHHHTSRVPNNCQRKSDSKRTAKDDLHHRPGIQPRGRTHDRAVYTSGCKSLGATCQSAPSSTFSVPKCMVGDRVHG